MINPWKAGLSTLYQLGALNDPIGHRFLAEAKAWDHLERIRDSGFRAVGNQQPTLIRRGWPENSIYHKSDFLYDNVYVDLKGRIMSHINSTPGLYTFDGQFFYKRRRKRG